MVSHSSILLLSFTLLCARLTVSYIISITLPTDLSVPERIMTIHWNRPLLLNATAPLIPVIKEEDVLRRRRRDLGKVTDSEATTDGPDEKQSESPAHRDEFQVELDVNRSFVHLPIGQIIICVTYKIPELTYISRRTP